MKLRVFALGAVASGALIAAGALAQPDNDELVIDGESIATEVAAPADAAHPIDTLISGWRFRNDDTQELQLDDFENPGFLGVDQGEELWATVDGTEGKSCASCHEDAEESMAGVRAEMPKWSEAAGQPWALENWVNNCRTTRMGAEAWKWEAQEMLGMTAYIGLQSRGMPVAPDVSGAMAEWLEKGEGLYYTRAGQLNLSCANCHEDNWGNMIRADHLSQGHSNGFPTYRLKWQGLGSLHRRFTGCMRNIRAAPYKRGSDEFIALELYLADRGRGLSVETPSVRQ